MTISFSKYSGCGNHFILVDDRSHTFPYGDVALIKRLCGYSCGIGADGIVLLQRGSDVPFAMRIFNADGSEAEMCGNGIRCLARYICDNNLADSDTFIIASMLRTHRCTLFPDAGGEVEVQMGPPHRVIRDLVLPVDDGTADIKAHFIDTGVPHLVVGVDDLNDDARFFRIAPQLRHHPLLQPHGANVNFVAIAPDSAEIRIRTYERGVEAETSACGTGACACAVAFATTTAVEKSRVVTRSGETLSIRIERRNGTIADLFMTGAASKIFDGTF